ncbi:MAG TPA: MmgE/PrpD family protein [Candidatus Lustribacter sp.]|nr:MmgE/PrpD family protein [Candidatus Lustribacter sp.]
MAGGDIPEDVRFVAKCCILDWSGCALAGSHEPPVEMLLAEILTAPEAPCGLAGRPERTSPHRAALVNGTAGDALDYSDVNRTLNGHATATVWPCILALAEAGGASGEAALRAFVAGVEAACRAGLLLGPGHLEMPFHPTAIAGPIGAAAGGAVLLGLDDARFAAALGIAATQAAGLADAVGTMCKPLHAGLAAAAGTSAARLAARGFTASPAALEADAGFLTGHTTQAGGGVLAATRGQFLIRQTLMKDHAACALAHGSIENMHALRGTTAFAPDDIATIRLQIAASSARVCDIVAPRTGLETKFSVRTVAAMALLGYDTALPGSYTDELAHAGDVRALRERITVDPRTDLDVAESRATLELRDGRVLEATSDERNADRDLERRRARAHAKFAALTTPYLDAHSASALEARIFALDSAPVADVRP